MPSLASLATAVPPFSLTADETRAYLARVYPPAAAERFGKVVETTRIRKRYVVQSAEELLDLRSRGERNAQYVVEATKLAEIAAREAILRTSRSAEISIMLPVSCTGYMMPSLDAHLINRIGLREDARRIPITELGCSAGAAGVGIASELVRGRPDCAVLVLAVELCSLCLQLAEPSTSDVLGSLIFADGAAAAVISSDDGAGPEVVASGSYLIPDTLERLETKLSTTGLRLTLSPSLPRLLRKSLRGVVDKFLSQAGFQRQDLRFHAVHPGGPKILESAAEALSIGDQAMRPSWEVLENFGNMSSATILFVLDRIATRYTPQEGDLGLVVSFGPGVTCELLLLRWRDGLNATGRRPCPR